MPRCEAHSSSAARRLGGGDASHPAIAWLISSRSTRRTSSLIGPTAAGVIDSFDDIGMMWGDSGRLYWWIREADLAEGRWDATWLVLQCY